MQIPIAGTRTVSTYHEKLRADLLFSGDLIALRAIDVPSKSPLLISVRPEKRQEVQAAFRSARVGVFGQPVCIQMGEGGEWEEEVRRPRILERRSAVARGI